MVAQARSDPIVAYNPVNLILMRLGAWRACICLTDVTEAKVHRPAAGLCNALHKDLRDFAFQCIKSLTINREMNSCHLWQSFYEIKKI